MSEMDDIINEEQDELDELPTEPSEEDWVTSDYLWWYHPNKWSGRYRVDPFHWAEEMKKKMEEDQFWPNCWYQGERGEWNLLSLEHETFVSDLNHKTF